MLRKRQWFLCFILSVVTGGAYAAYLIFYQLKDLKIMDDETEESNIIHMILYCLLFICTASIAGFVAYIIYEKRAVKIGKKYGVDIRPHSGLLFAMIMYIPVISFMVDVKNHNKLIDAYYSKGQISIESPAE